MATKTAYEKVFEELKKTIEKTDVSGFNPFAFQFTILGEGEGSFYFAVKDGKADIQPYDYTDHTAVFKATAETFKQLTEGKLAPSDAVSSGALIVEDGEAGCADIFNAIAAKKPAGKKSGSAASAPAKETKKETTAKPAPAKEDKAPAKEVKKEAAPAKEEKKEAAAKPAPKKEAKGKAKRK